MATDKTSTTYEIQSELSTLKAQKKAIEDKISSLESHLLLQQQQQAAAAAASQSQPTLAPLPATCINSNNDCSISAVHPNGQATTHSHSLPPDAIYRYSRHLLLPAFGVQGQSNLLKSSVLVVGAGGLGAPALLYIAACGVGRIGIVDHDVVELNNMHRQVIHSEAYIGKSKVESAAATCRSINSSVQIVEYREALRTSNALDIFSKYDLIIDATDNVPSRYMINDCCAVLGKPLVSGAALGLEGQLTVYNHNGGPCYRCLFPTPPPTTACQRCSDSGVLGVVPGVIGTLQALEAIKIVSAVGEPLSGRMLIFDALSGRMRLVKIRGRSLQCEVCGENSTFSAEKFRGFDYEKFTQTPLSTAPPKLKLIHENSRISCKEYHEKVVNGEAHILIDVRPSHHFDIISLPNSLNIPLSSLESRLQEISVALEEEQTRKGVADAQLYTVCRRGNDSQRAVELLHKLGLTSAKDIVGGLDSWAKEVDHNFPAY